MQILNFITSNVYKVEWANEIAEKLGYSIRFEKHSYNFEEGRANNVEEVIKEKIKQGIKFIKHPFIVEDSGFFIDSLNGFPGTYVKFGLTTIGIKGIIKLMEKIDDEKRTYSINSSIGYGNPISKRIHTVVSTSVGKLSKSYVSGNEHDWGEIMGIIIPNGYKTTITQFDDMEWLRYKQDIKNGDAFTVSLGKILKIINDEHA